MGQGQYSSGGSSTGGGKQYLGVYVDVDLAQLSCTSHAPLAPRNDGPVDGRPSVPFFRHWKHPKPAALVVWCLIRETPHR
jgi:hypothetical protein